jgi:hypothetical protein
VEAALSCKLHRRRSGLKLFEDADDLVLTESAFSSKSPAASTPRNSQLPWPRFRP